jgi:hypothetical protein
MQSAVNGPAAPLWERALAGADFIGGTREQARGIEDRQRRDFRRHEQRNFGADERHAVATFIALQAAYDLDIAVA